MSPRLHSCHHWHNTTRNMNHSRPKKSELVPWPGPEITRLGEPWRNKALRVCKAWNDSRGFPVRLSCQDVQTVERFIGWVVNSWCCNWSENVKCKFWQSQDAGGFVLHSTYSFSGNQTHDLSVASAMLDIQLDKTSHSGCVVFLKTVQTSWKVVNCICQDSCKVCTREPRLHLTYSRFLLSMTL